MEAFSFVVFDWIIDRWSLFHKLQADCLQSRDPNSSKFDQIKMITPACINAYTNQTQPLYSSTTTLKG